MPALARTLPQAQGPASGSLRRRNPRDVYRSGAAGAYGDCDLALAVVVWLLEAGRHFDASW